MDKTHEELATKLKNENEELRKQNKILYQSLKEIKNVNDELRADTSVTREYLTGFIDAKFSAGEKSSKIDIRKTTMALEDKLQNDFKKVSDVILDANGHPVRKLSGYVHIDEEDTE